MATRRPHRISFDDILDTAYSVRLELNDLKSEVQERRQEADGLIAAAWEEWERLLGVVGSSTEAPAEPVEQQAASPQTSLVGSVTSYGATPKQVAAAKAPSPSSTGRSPGRGSPRATVSTPPQQRSLVAQPPAAAATPSSQLTSRLAIERFDGIHPSPLHSDAPMPIRLDGVVFPTLVHFYHCVKHLPNPGVMNAIRNAPVAEAVALGRDGAYPLRPDWSIDVQVDVIVNGMRLKIAQNPEAAEALRQTASRPITVVDDPLSLEFLVNGSDEEADDGRFIGALFSAVRSELLDDEDDGTSESPSPARPRAGSMAARVKLANKRTSIEARAADALQVQRHLAVTALSGRSVDAPHRLRVPRFASHTKVELASGSNPQEAAASPAAELPPGQRSTWEGLSGNTPLPPSTPTITPGGIAPQLGKVSGKHLAHNPKPPHHAPETPLVARTVQESSATVGGLPLSTMTIGAAEEAGVEGSKRRKRHPWALPAAVTGATLGGAVIPPNLRSIRSDTQPKSPEAVGSASTAREQPHSATAAGKRRDSSPVRSVAKPASARAAIASSLVPNAATVPTLPPQRRQKATEEVRTGTAASSSTPRFHKKMQVNALTRADRDALVAFQQHQASLAAGGGHPGRSNSNSGSVSASMAESLFGSRRKSQSIKAPNPQTGLKMVLAPVD